MRKQAARVTPNTHKNTLMVDMNGRFEICDLWRGKEGGREEERKGNEGEKMEVK